MPSTAKLLSAMGSNKIHAHRPEENQTLCGLEVVNPTEYEGHPIPPRSADWTGKRFYIGLHRLMCDRCTVRAYKVRVVGSGEVSFPLAKVVNLR